MWMQKGSIRIDHQGKEWKEDQKGNDTRIEDLILIHPVGHARIQARKSNGRRQIDIRLDKGNDFGSWFGRRDHEDIFGISQDCVIEENTKEHETKRNELLSFIGRWKGGLDL